MDKKLKLKLISSLLSNDSGVERADASMRCFMVLFDEIPFVIDAVVSSVNNYFMELEKEFELYELFRISKFSKHHDEFRVVRVLVDFKNKILLTDDGYGSCQITYSSRISDQKSYDKYLHVSKEFMPIKKKKRSRGRIYILTIVGRGMRQRLSFQPFKLDNFDMAIDANYNDDFKPKSDEIIRRLNEKDGNGIVILHGSPGTGKTFYLKHLCKVLNKKILYIPPALVHEIVQPDFIKMLSKQKGSVLIIEDADNILRKRDEMSNIQDVSSLLNITDGMLHDVLKLQIVCTFNTNIQNIDQAFLRKGRLIAEHKFDPLTLEKAQALSDSLGFKTKINEPMLLTDIFNQDAPFFKEKKETKQIGFQKELSTTN